MITIAIDAMGGDNAPKAIVDGANLAIKTFNDIQINLYGDSESIEQYLVKDDRIKVIHTTEIVTGEDEPVRAIRRKKDSSMVVAARDVKEGKADALLSAGNTGALLTAGLLVVGRIKNIDRPGLMPIIPTVSKESPQVILMDAGANAEVKPVNLEQFTVLANFYAKNVLNVENPRIGLLNNGTEEGKGNSITKEAFDLMKQLDNINFIGNVEAKSILTGEVDIVITDGFTGNAVLKTLEGTVKSVVGLLLDTLKNSGLKTKIGAGLIKDSLKETFNNLDDTKQGGAVLLGVKSPVIKAHGSSNDEAIFNAIRQARTVVSAGVVQDAVNYFEN
ncbi:MULTISPECIES: phosphate acyltransferase PlsX [Ruoffia]|uniref:Phosphate acyltransferase n=1 Tax=Ruoffia tabacinasalis TaxID=87458 RepID=A0ABS0LKP4_9LACT|nr:phosphate acyltransferase PlsX [Ruoffia tabacinasalis]MBG9978812.1 phosphate acyltransferase PlsX [Ruoffia tabacinasalis]HJG47311.1 phosphate acyltransferase PlsX [Ruoffia tabacinasalis]